MGQDPITQALSLWPTIDDLPKDLKIDVIRCPGFNLEDHWRKMLVGNPFAPPKGCPINRLPTELLAHIFYLGCSTYDEEDEEEDDDEDEAYNDLDVEDDDEDDQDDGEDEEMYEDAWDGSEDSSRDNQGDVGMEEVDPAGPEISKMTPRGELPFQVLVSHVCTHWRAVAIESPVLWTSITFTEGSPFERSRTFIARSHSLPLDIVLDCTIIEDDDNSEDDDSSQDSVLFFTLADVSAILDIIIPLVERWHTLEVLVNHYEYMYRVLLRLSKCGPAPNLEVFQLYSYEELQAYDEFQPVHLSQSLMPFGGIAPNLTLVALWGVHIGWSAPLLSGLVDLELAFHAEDVRPSWADFSRILNDSPKIETLTLSLSGPAGQPADWPHTPIELPSLKNLVLAYHEPEYVCALIKLLWIPNVTSLALDFDDGDYTTLAKQLAASRSSPDTGGKVKSILANLESLKLSGLPCDHGTVDTIYEQLGSLKSLNLNCTFLDETFFNKLTTALGTTEAAAKAIYCPLLEDITTTGIDGRKMRELVERRKEYGVLIKKVFMSEEDDVELTEQSWLRENVESFAYFEPSDSEDDDEQVLVEDSDFED